MVISRKIIGVLGLAGTLCLGGVGTAYAAGSHIVGCQSQQQRVDCVGPIYEVSVDYHVLYTTVNGEVRCIRKAQYRSHELYCASNVCGAYLGLESRTCSYIHKWCPPETGCCQY